MSTEEELSTQLRKEDLAWKSERARGVRMKNDEAEGLLLPADEVKARISQAGVAFQRGQAATRRSIEALLCEGCREVFIAEYDGTMRATIDAVLKAWEGE